MRDPPFEEALQIFQVSRFRGMYLECPVLPKRLTEPPSKRCGERYVDGRRWLFVKSTAGVKRNLVLDFWMERVFEYQHTVRYL